MRDLSVLIPARNEMFLGRTVADVLANARADTEVIVVLDGAWPDEPLPDHPRQTIIHHAVSIGQRAATNEAAQVSRARYVMKLDAHCRVAEGFDIELIRAARELGGDVTQIPAQFNLHAFDWVCENAPCDWRLYQGPTPEKCGKCGGPVRREIVWQPRKNRLTTAWRFDADLHFQYWTEFQKREEGRRDLAETMSCLGACWFLLRERYWRLGGMDEAHGSWGQMGTELACKSWLSGGRMVTNKSTWFAHLFRTQGGDFGFPYPLPASDQEKAREYSQKLWRSDAWPGAVRPLSWLIDHFAPVPGWELGASSAGVAASPKAPDTRPAPSASAGGPRPKGIIYYSDGLPDPAILVASRRSIERAGLPIVAATLQPIDWPAARSLVLPLRRGILTMFRQILAALEASTADVVFFCEHDVLYHPSHFDFAPAREDVPYYNVNCWKVDAGDGRALFYRTKQTSGLCGYRELLVEHYRKRIARVEQNARDIAAAGLPVKRDGYDRAMGFEPGSHRRRRAAVDDLVAEEWRSPWPNVDIRHGANLTPSRWSPAEFRDRKTCEEWQEADAVPGWGVTRGRFADWLKEV